MDFATSKVKYNRSKNNIKIFKNQQKQMWSSDYFIDVACFNVYNGNKNRMK